MSKYTEKIDKALALAQKALEQEPCEDAIDRAEAMTEIMMFSENVKFDEKDIYIKVLDAVQLLRDLPSVTPQPKIGHWIEHQHEAGENWEFSKYECSECHVWGDDNSDYCLNCGAKMES